MGVGFWDATGTRFYGVVLHKEGTMTVVNGNDRTKPDRTTAIALNGNTELFDWETWYRLSYDVDTNRGTISNINLMEIATGDVVPYTFPIEDHAKLDFTNANTSLAGLYINSSMGGTYGYFDNFRIYKK